MKLRKYFDLLDREWVTSWVDSPAVGEAFCGLYPVTNRMFEEWYNAADQLQLILENEDREPLAYGEIWADASGNEVELAHLLVANDQRGKGVGKTLVNSLVEYVRCEMPRVRKIVIRVDSDNANGKAFLSKTGFTLKKDVPEDWDEEYSWFENSLS